MVRMAAAFASGALAVVLVLGVQACGGEDRSPASSTVATATINTSDTVAESGPVTHTSDGLTQTDTGTSAPATGNIHDVDFTAAVEAQPLVREIEDIIYTDLTGDGSEEALVLVRIAGSGAYLDYYVYTIKNGKVVNIFQKLEVSHGKVKQGTLPGSFVETAAIYAADDPNCCPSNILITTYAWAASAKVFTEVSVEMEPNPQASTALAV